MYINTKGENDTSAINLMITNANKGKLRRRTFIRKGKVVFIFFIIIIQMRYKNHKTIQILSFYLIIYKNFKNILVIYVNTIINHDLYVYLFLNFLQLFSITYLLFNTEISLYAQNNNFKKYFFPNIILFFLFSN